MANRGSLRNWIVIIGLLVFAGIASATLPFIVEQIRGESAGRPEVEREPAVVTIDVEDFLLGSDLMRIPFVAERIHGLELNAWMVVGLITGLTFFALGAIGVPLAFINSRLDRQVQAAKQDEGFKQAAAELEQEEAAEIKALRETRPVRPPAARERVARWSAVSTALLILLFVWFSLVAIRDSLGGGASAGNLVLIGVLASALLLLVIFRRIDPLKIDAPDSDYQTLNWGWVWVAISGLLILGLGTGLALAMSAG